MPAAIGVVIAAALPPPDVKWPESALVFRLAVTPAAPPVSKLRHELLPPRRDRTPGNAAVDYLRAAVLLPQQPRLDPDAWQAREDRLQKWNESPLDKLPVAAVKAELKPFDKALAAADRAARAARCDWQLPGPLTIKTHFGDPDPQALREAMRWLRYRVKGELAEGHFADAERSLQTSFQMAEHIGEGPTLIHSLVGVAIGSIAVSAAAEWGTAPGSPNLYWAIATLPDPLIDLRATAAGEAEVMANTFPAFREFEKGPASEARAMELIKAMRKDLQTFGDAAAWFREKPTRPGAGVNEVIGSALAFALGDEPTEFEAAVRRLTDDFAAVGRAPAARKWLRDRGVKGADAMPALQAAYLASWLRYRERFDDVAAAMLLPTREAAAQARRALAATRKSVEEARDDPVARALLSVVPALERVLQSHIRVRRQVAAVRAVEAVRAHLAASGGNLPRSWDEVTVVPVPDDPLTGKPFAYSLKDGVATITAPHPKGKVRGLPTTSAMS
jgi:hypothetical protein